MAEEPKTEFEGEIEDKSENISSQNVQPELESSLKSHLLFHKALISDDDSDDKLDDYIDLVEQLEHGMTIVYPDPFDRAIAITFELTIKHHFDPWDVDLVKFSNEYLKHVRKDKNLDLVTAGRIILMAWKILKLQSDQVLLNAQQVQKDDEEEYWPEPDGDWFTNDDDFEYTTAVINNNDPPIQEMVWRKGKRRVSLLELIGALEEAKRESEILKIINERHAEEREKLKLFRKKNINTKVHQENLQEDMNMIYQRISKFNGHPIPLSDIYSAELDDQITTIVSSLFLAFTRQIDIWQRKFPFGQIFVKNLNCEGVPGGIELGDHDNGGNGNDGNGNGGNGKGDGKEKVLISELDLTKSDKKKKKKLKDEMEELMTAQKNIAS